MRLEHLAILLMHGRLQTGMGDLSLEDPQNNLSELDHMFLLGLVGCPTTRYSNCIRDLFYMELFQTHRHTQSLSFTFSLMMQMGPQFLPMLVCHSVFHKL